MAIPTDDLSAVRRVQAAIRESVARTRKASEGRDNDFVFIGYVETIVWACALDDLLTKMDPDYEERRNADPGGQVLRGMRWARNQGVHQLLALHRDGGGLAFPATFPATFPYQPVWLDRTATAPKAKRQPANEQAYDQFVAGKSVAETLDGVQSFLWERAIPNQFAEDLPWHS
jgi:hypothetical protein